MCKREWEWELQFTRKAVGVTLGKEKSEGDEEKKEKRAWHI